MIYSKDIPAASNIIILVSIVLSVTVTCSGQQECHRRVCYYHNQAQIFSDSDLRIYIDQIPACLCSHVIYYAARFSNNTIGPHFDFETTKDADWPRVGFHNLAKVRENNPKVKFLLSVRIEDCGKDPFINLADNPVSASKAADDVVTFLRRYGFSGLEISCLGNSPDDSSVKYKLSTVLAAFNSAFKKVQSCKGPLLLTIMATGTTIFQEDIYDIPGISNNVDWINLMAFNAYILQSPITRHVSPLFGGETGPSAKENMQTAVDLWVKHGAPKQKLVLGFPSAGIGFVLKSSATELGAPTLQAAYGRYSGPHGPAWPYFEICQLISSGASVYFLSKQSVPYLVSGNQWIGFENPESVKEKIRFIKKQGLGGFATDLMTDDFSGKYCNEGTYPLLTAAVTECSKSSSLSHMHKVCG